MTKNELKQINKILDLILNLLETGSFPGKRAPQVLDAARFLTQMKEANKINQARGATDEESTNGDEDTSDKVAEDAADLASDEAAS